MAEQLDIQPLEPVAPTAATGVPPVQLDIQPLETPATSAPTLDIQPLTPAAPTQPRSTPQDGVTSGPVRDSEIEEIARRHGVDPEHLRDVAPYFGVETETRRGEILSTAAKETAGVAGEMALGIPHFIYKKTQTEPFQLALDDLREVSESRKTLGQKAMEMGRTLAAPLPAIGAKSAVGRLGSAVGIGAVAGGANAPTGKELQGAATGAALGGVLGTAGEGVGLLLGRGARPSAIELENIRTRQFDLEKAQKEVADRTAESEKLIEDTITGRKTALSSQDVDTIVKEQLGPEGVREYLDPTTPQGQIIRDKVGPRLGEETLDQAIPRQLADDIVDARAKEFSESLTGKKPTSTSGAIEGIEEVASRQGSEATAAKYRRYLELEQTRKAVEEQGLLARDQPGWAGQVANKLSDNQFALRHLDDKYGVGTEDALRELNKANNRYTFARNMTREDLDRIYQLANRSSGIDAELRDGHRIYDALEQGTVVDLSPEEQVVAGAFRGYFDNVREFSNHTVSIGDPNIAPLAIPHLENYVPHIAKPVNEIIPLVEQRVDAALEQVSRDVGRTVDSLSSLSKDEFSSALSKGYLDDLVKFADWTTGREGKYTSGSQLQRELTNKLETREGNIALESRARATQAREGEIPDFILEKNLYQLADRYALNTMKHLYLRNGLDRLGLEGQKLRAIGAIPEAEYVERIAQDTLGIRRGTAAEAFLQAKISAGRKFDEMIDHYGKNSPQGVVLSFAKGIPDILYAATRNIYTNVLGFWNVHSALMHMGTSIARLPPELGTKYGYSTVLRGALSTVMNFGRNLERAEAMGNLPAEFVRKGERAIRDGLLASKALRLPVDSYNALAHAGMALFQTGEKWNRALAVGTADMMAHDLVRGVSDAVRSVGNFPVSVRKQVVGALERKDEVALQGILSRYLNDTAQFNYNRSSLFEYGRTMGPLFSTFSKWPTSIAGEAIYELRSKGLTAGLTRSMERLVTPYLALSALNYMVFGQPGGKDIPDRARKITGAKGIQGIAPLGALHEFAGGKIFSPPLIDMAMKGIVVPALEGDPAKLSKGLDTALYNYVPGTGLVRFLTDDLVTYSTGSRPEGKTFTERAGSGLREIAK